MAQGGYADTRSDILSMESELQGILGSIRFELIKDPKYESIKDILVLNEERSKNFALIDLHLFPYLKLKALRTNALLL